MDNFMLMNSIDEMGKFFERQKLMKLNCFLRSVSQSTRNKSKNKQMRPNQIHKLLNNKEIMNKMKKPTDWEKKICKRCALQGLNFQNTNISYNSVMTKKQSKQKMGRRPKQTSFQRKHTDGQQVPEKRLGTDNSWRNANQNYSEISPHTSQNGHH